MIATLPGATVIVARTKKLQTGIWGVLQELAPLSTEATWSDRSMIEPFDLVNTPFNARNY